MNAPFTLSRPDVVHRAVVDVITAVFPTVSEELLFANDRTNACTAWVRQVAMYLQVERLGLTQHLTGQQFGRDRTTVGHACRLVDESRVQRPETAAFLDFLVGQVMTRLAGASAIEGDWGLV